MPRRIYTYEAGRGWEYWNLIVGVGAIVQAIGTLIFVYNLVHSYPSWEDCWTRSMGCSRPWNGQLLPHLLRTILLLSQPQAAAGRFGI